MKLSIRIRDSEGKQSTMTLYRANGALLADDIDNANDMAALIAPLTQGVVAGVNIEYLVDTDDSVPAGNIDNEIKAAFGFRTSDSTTARVTVPSFDRSLLIPNSDEVNREAPAVAAFLTELVDGGWTDYRDGDFVSVAYAQEFYGRKQK